jgi:hypothetical protein
MGKILRKTVPSEENIEMKAKLENQLNSRINKESKAYIDRIERNEKKRSEEMEKLIKNTTYTYLEPSLYSNFQR